MTHVRLLALLALSSTGCLVGPDGDGSCGSAPSCDACVQLAGCGWCPSRGCVAGTPAGPDVPSLFCEGDYRWDECGAAAPDPCAGHGADRCELATGCVWCEGRGVCSYEGARCGPPVAPGGWTPSSAAPRSPHPYYSSMDDVWSLGVPPGASEVRVHFGRVELEEGYDVVELLARGSAVHTITGEASGQVVTVPGATEIRLTTDGSVERWGFEIVLVEYR